MIKRIEKYRKQIDVTKLISMYHRFKRNPHRVFIMTDLKVGGGTTARTYLHLFTVLGIIEIVPVYYKATKYSCRNVKGYKLKND